MKVTVTVEGDVISYKTSSMRKPRTLETSESIEENEFEGMLQTFIVTRRYMHRGVGRVVWEDGYVREIVPQPDRMKALMDAVLEDMENLPPREE